MRLKNALEKIDAFIYDTVSYKFVCLPPRTNYDTESHMSQISRAHQNSGAVNERWRQIRE